jgi:hypothetical protein
LLGAMAIVALLAIAGCGSSGEDTASGTAVTVKTSSLSRAQFVKKADEICERGTAKLAPVVNKAIVGSGSVKQVEAAVVPVLESLVDEIGTVGAPKGDEAKIEAFLTATQEAVEQIKADPSSSMQEFAKRFKKSGDLARSYEIDPCALG